MSDSLRYFLEVARTGSITEASERLHIAASAISRQIARLELEAGVRLFDRHPRGMVLTEAGEVLANHARRSVLDEEDVLRQLHDVQEAGRSLIRVACSEGFAQHFMPEEMARFRKARPGTRFQLDVLDPALATQRVADGTCDVAVTFSMAPETGIRVEHSHQEPVVVLVPQGHPLSARNSIALADLGPYPLALMDEGTTIRSLFDVCCSVEGLAFEPVLVSRHLDSAQRPDPAGRCRDADWPAQRPPAHPRWSGRDLVDQS
ncbi:LysR family transcriptional regulator [Aeromicrobium sp. UC242_57]|uniref:LysR family transcriptional regulator n=1 Tax=Aeromicrobium sp. UC242_57 TaxID=3374624 RepID=UPI0037BA227A